MTSNGKIMKALKTIFFVIFLTSCSTSNLSIKTDNALVNNLKNRGAVPLSSSNPYLAGNQLLQKEMTNSPELKGFIEHRGTPKAIEVVKQIFSPMTLRLYYPKESQYFSVEAAGDAYVIQGPFGIPDTGLKLLSGIVEQSDAPAAFDHATIVTQAKPDVEDSMKANLVRPETPQIPETPVVATPASDDPQISEIKQIQSSLTDSAELTPQGDIVHYVTYPGETLMMIARWYSHDWRNAGRLARINKLKRPDQLSIGDMIIVPSYLVKSKLRLTDSAVNTLSK